jgi:hypothetical protein
MSGTVWASTLVVGFGFLTFSSTPASRMRCIFSEALNQRSIAHTCTPNSLCKKIDDAARPQPRSSTRMPGRGSTASASHSLSQRALAAPLMLARIHSDCISQSA